jgi:YidC/Oxa1 family membrane protein insertase
MDKRTLFFVFALSMALMVVNSWFTPSLPKPCPPKEVKEEISPAAEPVPPPKENSTEYYVLENEYQQLVFSSKGGSIVEINLPFKGPLFPHSVVLPVETDKKLAEQCPEANRFPLVQAHESTGVIKKQTVGGYYPLLRRSDEEQPGLAALALTSEYKEFSSLPFHVVSFSPTEIVLEAKQARRHIQKKISFPKDVNDFPYCFDVEIAIDGERKGIEISSGVPEIEWISGASGATLKYRVVRGDKGTVERIDLPKTTFRSQTTLPDWICNSNGFFGIILDPLKDISPGMTFTKVEDLPSRITRVDHGIVSAATTPGYDAFLPYPPTAPKMQMRMFAGPFAESVLKTIDANSLKVYEKPTNYVACQTFHGFFAFISEPFAKFLFIIMNALHSLTHSWGLSIILTTVVLRILMYPLNQWSMRSMRSMQEISPLIKAIQEKYKKEPSKAQAELMALYREKKVNPFSGCLPLIIQMPFLIGMFDLLKTTFELRGAPFIPGWITDLSAPDVVLDWHFSFFLIGSQLHLLPILLGATMWWQQSLSGNLPKDQKQWTDQQRQQRAVGNIMTVVMTVLFYQFPSGLNIYWISSMLLGILQQWWTNRKMTKASLPVPR